MQIAAAFIFFTRLPLWRVVNVPKERFRHIVALWPLTGWLTALASAAVLYGAAFLLPEGTAVLPALAARILLTGALHEDGLADFFDGLGGGGTDRERILSIMKDSRIGTYGVVALALYFLLLWNVLASLPLPLACLALLAGDPFCKWLASQTVNLLPYARTEAQSKAKVVYEKMSPGLFLTGLVFGLLPLLGLLRPPYWAAALFPTAVYLGLVLLVKRRIRGYTGDCCGAVFLLCELAFYLGILILYTLCHGSRFYPPYLG